ncbi:hormogonium polysaccharide secretion pseudopilin HpsB [Dolichospermum sp. UHCC 0259]|uniref:hormogonium polysaccharide secretion pseudopilin HpsB n=1 Tax=Dolichospermum sp. UHCC 0259 TaxID=2590010 RepID=UPI001445874B|nr:hormogonium polysaccharide secretion pseudopilin HpsB [Dolichospermum sp. UHCC 0259]MTJ47639.1 type II secretion system protein [Dolichospermum sp. UHCC 0259]
MVQLIGKRNISKDDGFTIIESLVAMIVASALMLAIAPVLILSTATRVQSRRVELGSKAATSFIDAVRSGRIATQSTDGTTEYITTVKEIDSTESSSSSRSITDSNNINDYLISDSDEKMPVPSSAENLYCVQSDGIILTPGCSSVLNQKNLFYIQAGRTRITNSGTNDGYRLAVRVYRQDIDFTKPVSANEINTKNTQEPVTAGSGNKQAPILEMAADVANANTSFKALCNRLGFKAGSDTKPCN